MINKIWLCAMSVVFVACSSSAPEATATAPTSEAPKDTKPVVYDSMSVEDAIAEWPFADSLSDYKKFEHYTAHCHPEISTDVQRNSYDNSVKDTIKTIIWGESYIKANLTAYGSEAWMETAIVTDSTILFKKGLHAGMRIEEVFRTFGVTYLPAKTYKYLELYHGDGASYLTVYFKNGKVEFIRYDPYRG